MGKKSKNKQQRKAEFQAWRENQVKAKTDAFGLERFLLWIIYLATASSLFTPLIFGTGSYFPYVGPKSLFFMACVEIAFFAWLCLAFYYKKYRPRLNYILIALSVFLLIFILSAFLGVDPSRSFWSKYERMTGVLMWLHLFAFFLVLSSTFKKISDWKKFFLVSIAAAVILCVLFLLIEYTGAWYERTTQKSISGLFPFARGGGATLGNSSFLGSYVLFNIFLAIYLFFSEKKNWLRIASALAVVICFFAVFKAGARAATLASVGGFTLVGLLFLSFYPQSKKIKLLGRGLLALTVLLVFTTAVLLFAQGSFVRQEFIKLASRARFVNWAIAWKGFLEKPVLGWGPENYDVLFTQFFNPCLFTKACGGEIWFDRTHNIVLDTLATSGLLGFLSYLGLFAAWFWVLIKKYFFEKTINFWVFGVFAALPAAYFVQNLTVFDMVASLMMLVISLSFMAFWAQKDKPQPQETPKFILKRKWFLCLALFFLFVFLFEFAFKPFRADKLVIDSVRTVPSGDLMEQVKKEGAEKTSQFLAFNSEQRVALYKKTLLTSSLGKYQVRDFFSQTTQDLIREQMKYFPDQQAKQEIDLIVQELEKSVKESPLDYRSVLKLTQTYNLYAFYDSSKLALAEQYGQKAMALSPTNQQSYWVLAQTYLYQNKPEQAFEFTKKAIELEPNWLQSYTIAYQIAGLTGNATYPKEIKEMAGKINPDWPSQIGE